ncbi:MAG TPA: alpha/beta hydrolase-fold protein [Gaiellaceae bacterium]|nr:alpha/beta hydrolase-fold protein [Gaiellaceae bacterium]
MAAALTNTVDWRRHTITSAALRGNPLGDPHERDLWVWSPPDQSRRYPSVYVLHAHMRSAASWFNVEPFERSYPEAIAALAPEAVVVLVDGWTSVGGSQWIDSEGIGRYGTYLQEEVVQFVDASYPTDGTRGLQGKSSGGYGALVNALARPDLFSAVAAHAADALFEVTLAHGFPAAARMLAERGITSMAEFWESFSGLNEAGNALLVELGSCALAFGNGELPFDPETAAVLPELWEPWLAHDPIRLIEQDGPTAAGLRAIWIDAGGRDEYYLDRAAFALRRAIRRAGFPEERLHFELFPGGHRGLSDRYPLSLAFLVERLSMSL